MTRCGKFSHALDGEAWVAGKGIKERSIKARSQQSLVEIDVPAVYEAAASQREPVSARPVLFTQTCLFQVIVKRTAPHSAWQYSINDAIGDAVLRGRDRDPFIFASA